MTFSARVTTITQDKILPKIADTVLGGNFITFRHLAGNAMKWSGETLKRPLKYQKSTLGGSFSGLDTHSTSTVEDRVMMSYDLRGYEMPVSISGMDKAVNRTDAQVLQLVRVELESRQEDALDDLGTMFYGDGTGNSSKDFNGYDNLIDDGTTASTVGNLSRTTYPTLDGTRTASGGTLDLDKVATLVTATSRGSSKLHRPTFFSSDETVRDLYESLLTPYVRNNINSFGLPTMTMRSKAPIQSAEMRAAAGFEAYTFRGIPWLADEKSTSQTLWAVNENFLKWYGLRDPDLQAISLGTADIEGPYSEAPSKNVGLQWTGFRDPINQYGQVGHIYLLGNFANWNPKDCGRLTGLTGV